MRGQVAWQSHKYGALGVLRHHYSDCLRSVDTLRSSHITLTQPYAYGAGELTRAPKTNCLH